MGSVSVLRARTFDSKILNPKSDQQGGAESEQLQASLRASLEAENMILQLAVSQLLLDVSALREAAQRPKAPGKVVEFQVKSRDLVSNSSTANK
jgi:hypothetical protein